LRSLNRKPAWFVAGALLIFVALRCWNHVPFERRVPLSTAVWSADGELLRFTLAADDQYRLWTPLSEMPAPLVEAFLLKEDQWFYWHPGVNPVAMVRAGFRSWRGVRQGGSTLTMQLARLLYRMNTKTPTGKLKQAGTALWLEVRYSKRELLEAYLNLVPFGGNIQGAGAASRLYFGKAPDRLSAGEAITLAVIPQRPSVRAGHTIHEAELQNARIRLAREWRKRHDDVALPMDLGLARSVPELAPHFVDALIGERAGRTGRLDTTLDAELQRLMQRQVARYIGQYGERGIQNAAALLVDTRDMGVKAWLGSADYRSEAIDGQVNGVLAKRSPGSTLKPFIYGLALDQGVLHPRTILKDAPTSFGPFTPENFDGRFLGPISAEEALVRSRNVPAVWVATQLKQPTLFQFLESAGVSKLQSEEHYGLSLALGGGEVTMEELAGMYAMLANQGVLHRLRVEKAAKRDEGVRLLSAEAAFVTVDMLRHNPRPDEDGTLAVRTRWPVAWKTGTSWGFRDAWTAGIVGPYVLVVWIGDFRGKSNPSFVGVEAAAPLFFRIADSLNLARSKEVLPQFVPPAGVSKVAVCAASGDLPNAWCPNTVDTWYIPGKSPIRVSQLHRAVAVDINTGKPVCPPYGMEAVRLEVFEFWSSDMLKLFREAGVPRRKPPAQACAAVDSAEAPRISSPLRSVSYTFRRSAPAEVISLEASAAADVRQVFWFDGVALIGRAAVGEGALGWRPTADGAHLLRIIDDHGRAAERDVQVQFAP
jgi:penicillin-binding protein 1C